MKSTLCMSCVWQCQAKLDVVLVAVEYNLIISTFIKLSFFLDLVSNVTFQVMPDV